MLQKMCNALHLFSLKLPSVYFSLICHCLDPINSCFINGVNSCSIMNDMWEKVPSLYGCILWPGSGLGIADSQCAFYLPWQFGIPSSISLVNRFFMVQHSKEGWGPISPPNGLWEEQLTSVRLFLSVQICVCIMQFDLCIFAWTLENYLHRPDTQRAS